jgi:hypothetical protein
MDVIGESSCDFPLLFRRPSPPSADNLMPKAKSKAGVSRQVKVSQPGPQGQVQTTILNQPAIVRRREAATKVQADLLQGILWPAFFTVYVAFNYILVVSRTWGRRKTGPWGIQRYNTYRAYGCRGPRTDGGGCTTLGSFGAGRDHPGFHR